LSAESPTRAAQALANLGWSTGWLTTQTLASDDTANLRAAGFSRLWWKGQELSLNHTDAEHAIQNDAQLVIDRFVPSPKIQSRIAEAFTTAYRRGGGVAVFTGRDGNTRTFMARAECHEHGPLFEAKPTPRHFSFNSRMGACPLCEGVGSLDEMPFCPQCNGARLNAAARAVSLGGIHLHEITAQTIHDAADILPTLKLSSTQQQITAIPLEKLIAKLDFLARVGVGYISLDRAARSLSSGEAQRMRLATLLGVGLTGVNYVLDEPTTGLHSQDTERLMQILLGLRDMGNTLLVVEHDLDTIQCADNIIDVGPGAGVHGGHIVASGSPKELVSNTESITGAWLAGKKRLPAPSPTTKPIGTITLQDPTLNNLRTGPITFPTGQWIAVTGVSGAGKSSLVFQTLAPALDADTVTRTANTPDRVVLIKSAPIGGTPRSTPATSAKLLDHIRALFSATPLARQRGYKPTRFSFNAKQGRCATCEGRGAILVPMHFLPDVWNNCHGCDGGRFNPETLAIRYNGRSISEVLGMRVDEARVFFDAHRSLSKKLQALIDVGLGYITLGQPGNTLSAGEGQRLRLARELASRKGHCAYLLDEPTSGLHMADIAMLTRVLQRLVEAGHTVIMVEHHRELIQRVDHIIDLGPGGGEAGGLLIGEGTPQHIATLDTPTGLALRRA
jgi:excinuclease ABC subunit A